MVHVSGTHRNKFIFYLSLLLKCITDKYPLIFCIFEESANIQLQPGQHHGEGRFLQSKIASLLEIKAGGMFMIDIGQK